MDEVLGNVVEEVLEAEVLVDRFRVEVLSCIGAGALTACTAVGVVAAAVVDATPASGSSSSLTGDVDSPEQPRCACSQQNFWVPIGHMASHFQRLQHRFTSAGNDGTRPFKSPLQ